MVDYWQKPHYAIKKQVVKTDVTVSTTLILFIRLILAYLHCRAARAML